MQRTNLLSPVFALLFGILAVHWSFAVMDRDDLGQPVFLPRGVAEPGGRTGYVTNASAGIDAIDLPTGELLWSTEVATRPLLVFDDRLAAQRSVKEKPHVLEIVVLDVTQQGKLVLTSDPMVFPDWLSITPGTEESFAYKVFYYHPYLTLEWHAHARYKGGAAPPPHILEQATKDAAGTARMNLETGQVEMLPHTRHAAAPLPDGLHDVTSRPYLTRSGWHTDPWVVGKKLCALVSEESEGREALYLKMWDVSTAQTHEPILLVTGNALVPYVTPDGRYLFIHQELPPAPQAAETQAWLVFSAETGQRIAQLDYEPGTQEACVLESRVYYLTEGPPVPITSGGVILPDILKARELTSGQVLWERTFQARRVSKPPALRP
jgi:hypothetical protein